MKYGEHEDALTSADVVATCSAAKRLVALAKAEEARRQFTGVDALVLALAQLVNDMSGDVEHARAMVEKVAASLCKSRSNNPSLKRPMCSVAPD